MKKASCWPPAAKIGFELGIESEGLLKVSYDRLLILLFVQFIQECSASRRFETKKFLSEQSQPFFCVIEINVQPAEFHESLTLAIGLRKL